MKKLLLPFLALLFLISCEKESTNELNDLITEDQIYEDLISGDGSASTRSSNKRDVCHNGNIINININAIPAHQAHGDAVDIDGDGYFDIDNPCSETDCDDTTYDPENSCGCVVGEHEIDFNGPLFVAPADEPGLYNWEGAKAACAAKAVTDECDWYLPTKSELNAMFQQLGPSGNNNFVNLFYWSSTELDGSRAWAHQFGNGFQTGITKSSNRWRCRCVRR